MNCAMSLISCNSELGFYNTHKQRKTCLALQKIWACSGVVFFFACLSGKGDRQQGEVKLHSPAADSGLAVKSP